MVGVGDSIELIGREQQEISVADIVCLYAFDKDDLKTMRRAIEVKALPENWRGYFQHQLEKANRLTTADPPSRQAMARQVPRI